MAKAPDTIERFRIHADISQERVGGVLALLTKLGVDNIGFDLITDVQTFRHNGARKDTGSTSERVATEWVKDHPTFKAKLLVEHFEAHGRSANAAYGALKSMVGHGFLKPLGDGNYQRADIQSLDAPAKGKRAATHPRYDVSNRDIIQKFVGRRQKFAFSELGAYFEANGRPRSSASGLVSTMTSDGIFKSLGDSQYEVLKPGAINGKASANG